ncbi:MAG: glycosyltransferase family 2 protein [Clostridiales bacterium]|nr:glycosyltransferase family 2 protein [Clostridiales bacterium]
MKLITFAVPCYNSEAYMSHCVESLLSGGKDVEIILVDDGSKDGTGAIADQYAATYPDVVRVIHQENGGHGEGVNQGLAHASGLYYKVVDSDDWVNETSLAHVLETMREHLRSGWQVDMYVTNFVYEHIEEGYQRIVEYSKVFPVEQICTWGGIKGFKQWDYMMMHSVIYRTEALKESGVHLPKHTFYVDNIMVYQPLPHMKTLCYLNENFYRYYIGRDGQSIEEDVMIRRVDQQIRVTKIMLNSYSYAELAKLPRPLYKYMINYMSKIMCITSMFLLLADQKNGTEVHTRERDQLWQEVKERDPKFYRRLRTQVVSLAATIPGKYGPRISIFLYHIAQKIFKFN